MSEQAKQKPRRPPPLPGALKTRLARWAVLVIIALAGVGVTFNSCTQYVRPYEVGVKESQFGGGVQPGVLPGGYLYLTGPGVSVHRLPTDVQAIQMSSSASEASEHEDGVRNVAAIEIDTSDGSKVKVDVTILYRIVDAYKVITGIGKGRLFEDSAIIPKATATLKKNLGQLLAEDFYHEVKRLQRTEAARQDLNTALADKGLEVDHILIRQYYYEQGYQKQIEERKIKDQLVFTNTSAAESAKEDARRRKIVAEGEAAVAVEQRRGEAEITKIRAEADLEARKKRAEGDLLVSMAQAQGTELENAAYEGVGSPNIVAEKMAEALSGLEVIIVPSGTPGGINPLDVEAMSRAFGVR